MNKYEIILLDADDTLLDFKKTEKDALKKTFKKINYTLTNEVICMFQKINGNLWKQYLEGLINIQDAFVLRFKMLFEELEINLNAEEVEKIHNNYFNKGYYLIKDAFKVCETLAKNHNLYIISNALQENQTQRLKGANLTQFMKGVFTSDEIGATKPSIEFFCGILSKIPYNDKKNILIVGDSLDTDILGGNNIGIDTCWYNPSKEENNSIIQPTYEINGLKELLRIV